jgi:hypothetical protein
VRSRETRPRLRFRGRSMARRRRTRRRSCIDEQREQRLLESGASVAVMSAEHRQPALFKLNHDLSRCLQHPEPARRETQLQRSRVPSCERAAATKRRAVGRARARKQTSTPTQRTRQVRADSVGSLIGRDHAGKRARCTALRSGSGTASLDRDPLAISQPPSTRINIRFAVGEPHQTLGHAVLTGLPVLRQPLNRAQEDLPSVQ